MVIDRNFENCYSECVGTEQKAAEPTEPENPEPEKKSNTGAILAVLLILAAGGGAAVYFLVLKPKQGKKVPADLDDFDLEDEDGNRSGYGYDFLRLMAPYWDADYEYIGYDKIRSSISKSFSTSAFRTLAYCCVVRTFV